MKFSTIWKILIKKNVFNALFILLAILTGLFDVLDYYKETGQNSELSFLNQNTLLPIIECHPNWLLVLNIGVLVIIFWAIFFSLSKSIDDNKGEMRFTDFSDIFNNNEGYYKDLYKIIDNTTQGLKHEIRILSERADKFYKTAFLFISLGVLAFLVLFVVFPFNKISVESILMRYPPIILFELLGFYFLALYKSTLYEIKYFYNELNSLLLKVISLYTALNTEDINLKHKVIEKMIDYNPNDLLLKSKSKNLNELKETVEIIKSLLSVLKKEDNT